MGMIQNRQIGSLTSNKGILGPHTPYLVVRRKANYNPSSLSELEGLPANSTYKLSACVGFTRVKEINLRNIPATEEEINMLHNILTTGVHI